jgi:hypothetical protein
MTVGIKQLWSEQKPYGVFYTNGRYLVYKVDENGDPIGRRLGEHETLEQAQAQVAALYANEEKGALPYRDYGISDEGTAWSAPTLTSFTDLAWDDLDAAEKRRIMAHFAWSANVPPDTFGDLKLPHHAPAKSGVGPAVWGGVRAAMAALLGARGGVDIPANDRRGVYEHLLGHYRQFEKEPPEFHSQAGPAEPPTDDGERKRMLRLLDAEIDEISLYL